MVGAKRGLRSCEIFPTFYRNLLPALISKNLDDLLCPPVTAGNCNAFSGERFAANLRSLQNPKLAADQMAFTELLKSHEIAISMDCKGAWRDNVFVERLWRTIKYEEVYLRAYTSVLDQPPIRPDTWRNREGLGVSLGIRLCRNPLSVLKSSPASIVVGAILPRKRSGWSNRPCSPA